MSDQQIVPSVEQVPSPPVESPNADPTPTQAADQAVSGTGEDSSSEAGPSREELNATLSKVRSDEKAKYQPKLDKAKDTIDTLKSQLSDKESALKTANESIRQFENSDLSETERLRKEAEIAKEQVAEATRKAEEATKQVQIVADEAATAVLEARMDAYKQRRISEVGLTLTELVSGNSEEDIEASIATAKAREDQIFSRAREEERVKLAGQLPRPIAPSGGNRSGSSTEVFTPIDRQSASRLKGDDYRKVRDSLMDKAKQAMLSRR